MTWTCDASISIEDKNPRRYEFVRWQVSFEGTNCLVMEQSNRFENCYSVRIWHSSPSGQQDTRLLEKIGQVIEEEEREYDGRNLRKAEAMISR